MDFGAQVDTWDLDNNALHWNREEGTGTRTWSPAYDSSMAWVNSCIFQARMHPMQACGDMSSYKDPEQYCSDSVNKCLLMWEGIPIAPLQIIHNIHRWPIRALIMHGAYRIFGYTRFAYLIPGWDWAAGLDPVFSGLNHIWSLYIMKYCNNILYVILNLLPMSWKGPWRNVTLPFLALRRFFSYTGLRVHDELRWW